MASRRYEPRGFPRPALDSGQWLLVAFAGLLVIWSVAQTAVSGVRDVRAALAFGALIAFGELLRLNLPGDREAAPIATAGAMAYALLLRIGNTPARPEVLRIGRSSARCRTWQSAGRRGSPRCPPGCSRWPVWPPFSARWPTPG